MLINQMKEKRNRNYQKENVNQRKHKIVMQMLNLEQQRMEEEMLSLPVGYISKKTIKGNIQYYLQRREGTKVVGSYIRVDMVEEVSNKIERRKTIIEELSKISERLCQLEQAAQLIDEDLFCNLMVYKLSSGMDSLNSQEKERCSSFGYAMNAIEGVPVSKETAAEIDAWKSGTQTFLSVFENTLKRYGFPVEVR